MLSPAKSFHDLIVWQKAHEFVLETYNLTKQFLRNERYCLIPQMRRAAISIPAKIAEGFKKRGLPTRIDSSTCRKDRWKSLDTT